MVGAFAAALVLSACGSSSSGDSGSSSLALTSLTQNADGSKLTFTWVPSYNFNYAIQSNKDEAVTNFERVSFGKKSETNTNYDTFSDIGEDLLTPIANGGAVSFAKGKTITMICSRTSLSSATKVKYSCVNSSKSTMRPTIISFDPSGDYLLDYNVASYITLSGTQPDFSKNDNSPLWELNGYDASKGKWKTLKLLQK